MLTPMFELSQDDNTITVTIYAPNARLQDTEVTVFNEVLYFTSVPYYLRLHFPHQLKDSESGGCSAALDGDRCAFVVVCQKQKPGQHFEGLDMITDLLTPKQQSSKPKIEVLNDSETSLTDAEAQEDDVPNLDDEWLEPQELPVEGLLCHYKYGFADTHSDLAALEEGLYGVLDLPSPNTTAPAQRRVFRDEDETTRFNDQHYLADLFEKEASADHFLYRPEHCITKKNDVMYTSEEKAALLQLPRRELLVDPGKQEAQVLVGLSSVLLSWCYNDRITAGEECVASAWNINKLSPLLSWLDCPLSVPDSVQIFIRRCLVFPLLRHFDFALHVVADTVQLLRLGKKQVLKSLLAIRKTFNETENFYLLNDLYITEYSIWLQTVPESKLGALADSLERMKLQKSDMNLHLDALERVGQGMLEDEDKEVDSDDDVESIDGTAAAASASETSVPSAPEQQIIAQTAVADEGTVVKQLAQDLQVLTFSNPLAEGDNNSDVLPVGTAKPLLSPNNNTGVAPRVVPDNSSSDSESDSSSDSDSSSSESSTSSSSSESDDESSSSELDSDDDECPPQQPPPVAE